MGRTYWVDASVQQVLSNIISSAGKDWSIGLVIGHLSAQRDYVVYAAATPRFEPPDSVESCDPDQGLETLTTLRSSASKNEIAVGESLDTVNEKRITNHARQAHRMLTGGLDIIGIFVIASADEVKTAQPKLRQILFAMHKVLGKSNRELGSSCHGDRLLLHLCPITNKYTCRTFDVTDHKSAANPAEWKIQRTTETFITLMTPSFSFDVIVPVRNESLSQNLQAQMLTGLTPVFRRVADSLAVLDSKLLADESAPMSRSSSEQQQPKQQRGRGRKQQQHAEGGDEPESYVIDLLQNMGSMESGKQPVMFGCGATMKIRGTIASTAFVHSKATVGEAVQALKADIIRSVVSRCELLCEDLLQGEEEQDEFVLYETPTRVFASLSAAGPALQVCDYLFPDETTADAADRFRELLGLEVDVADIDSSREHVPAGDDLVEARGQLETNKCHPSSRTALPQLQTLSLGKYIGAAVGVAAAAVATYYMALAT